MFIRRFIPTPILLFYHYVMSVMATFWYGNPAKQLFVVAVTGTKGKTSTVRYFHSVLNNCGMKTGLISSAELDTGLGRTLNMYHMSTPSPWIVQRLLRDMLRAGCQAVALEVSSEGIKQYRHIGLYPDLGVFTNLSPEHLASHNNSVDEYRNTKGKLFTMLRMVTKKFAHHIPKDYAYIMADNEYSPYYQQLLGTHPYATFGIDGGDFQATEIYEGVRGVRFVLRGIPFETNVAGVFQIYNALPAILCALEMGYDTALIQKGVAEVTAIPGRMEWIECGQPFQVLVDYAHEKLSMHAVLKYARGVVGPTGQVIALVGAEGGGRDPRKRQTIMEACKKYHALAIITTVDPYEEPQESIATDMLRHGMELGMTTDDMIRIDDRREAIQYAFAHADKHTMVILAGKGAEQSMSIAGKQVPWDDRQVARELLKQL